MPQEKSPLHEVKKVEKAKITTVNPFFFNK